jgi:hypothetical protein
MNSPHPLLLPYANKKRVKVDPPEKKEAMK